jgi:hypothetical protein
MPHPQIFLLSAVLVFTLACESLYALPIPLPDGRVVESTDLSVRRLVRLSRKLNGRSFKAAKAILNAIALKSYRDSRYIIAFEQPLSVRGRDIWYVRQTKVPRERLVELLAAAREQTPGNLRAISDLESCLSDAEPSPKKLKLDEPPFPGEPIEPDFWFEQAWEDFPNWPF